MPFRTKNCLFLTLLVVAAGRPFALEAFQERPEAIKSGAVTGRPLSQYVLGPHDVIMIMAVDWEEVANKPIPIGTAGDITLTMAGRIHAAGMTVSELEEELTKRMKKFLKNPEIAVTLVEFKSQPVILSGEFRSPGTKQLEGQKTLLEVISEAGDLGAEASATVTITRRKEWGELPFSQPLADGSTSTRINLNSIRDASAPEKNIQIQPYDVIAAHRAPTVYAVGQVVSQGRYLLSNIESVSVVQLLGMAGGTTGIADLGKARIIRPIPDSIPIEVAVDLKKIRDKKATDIMLKPGDILVVPENGAKKLFQATLSNVVQTVVTLPLYRF